MRRIPALLTTIFLTIVAVATVPAQTVLEDSPLRPVKTDTPRDTMKTFMEAMNDYREGVESKDNAKKARIDDAVQCLDLNFVQPLSRREMGRETAILLKEVIDRVIVVDYEKVPDEKLDFSWRLKGTSIKIGPIESGDRKGEYLFTQSTASRARQFYNMVEHLPYLPASGQGAHYTEPWLERNVPQWLKQELLFFPAWQWIGLFLAILFGLMLRTLARWFIHRLGSLAKHSRATWDDQVLEALERPSGLVVAAVFWFVAIHLLRFEGTALNALSVAVQVVFSIGLIWSAYRLADVLTEYLTHLTSHTHSALDDQMVPLLRKALKVFVVVFGALVTLQNLNVNVMSVLTGLGLGGLAFALAAKDACANIFGSVMILLDKPFQIGDWVVAAGQEGTVEEIGFRSTRIRTFYNSVISVPNSVIANANIDNMGRRKYRRIKTFLALTYDTPPEKLEAFLEGVKNIIKANPHTRKDYYHVVFNRFGDSSLDVMLYCFLKVPDWASELVERQNIFLEIWRLAKELGVEFAYPTQSLYMESFPGQPDTRPIHDQDRDALAAVAGGFGPNGALAHPAGQGLFVPPHREAASISRGNDDEGE